MLKRTVLLSAVLLSFAPFVFSQGTTGFELLRSDAGARGAAVAGAMVGFDSGFDGLFYNPAAIAGLENTNIQATYLNHLLDIESGSIVYGRDFKGYASAALGVNYVNYGNFKRTDASGYQVGGDFSPSDLLIILGAGKKLNEAVSVGVNLKYIRSEIWEVSASAAAVDVGALIDTGWKYWTIGAGVFNLGKSLDGYYDYKEKLPLTYKVGASKPLEHLPLTIMLQGEKYQDSGIYFSAGGEFTLNDRLKLRLGWSTRSRDQKAGTNRDIFAGASAGLGIAFKSLNFDYALSSMGEMGVLNRISIGSVL